MARQGLYRDNQANLYALAVLAYQSGHSKFLLADELTKRPLIGKPHAGEGSALSVILISVNEKPAIPEGISVWARRETALVIIPHKYLQKSTTCNPVTNEARPEHDGGILERQIWEKRGLEIHDPDRPVFRLIQKIVSGGSLIWRLWLRHFLGSQLSWRSTFFPTQEMPELFKIPCAEHLVIFILFPATSSQMHKTATFIHDAVRKQVAKLKSRATDLCEFDEPSEYEGPSMTFESTPWDKHGIRSRRDLMKFWSSCYHPHASQSWRPPYICFLSRLQMFQLRDLWRFALTTSQ